MVERGLVENSAVSTILRSDRCQLHWFSQLIHYISQLNQNFNLSNNVKLRKACVKHFHVTIRIFTHILKYLKLYFIPSVY